MKKIAKKSLLDAYQFDGFKTSPVAKGKVGDKNARVLSLSRRSKKVFAASVASFIETTTTGRSNLFVIYHAVTVVFILSLKRVGFFVK